MESIKKKRAEDNDKVKEQQRIRQEECRIKKRKQDNVKVKEQQRIHQEESMLKKRAEDNAKVKEQQRKHQEESMTKKRAQDNEKVKGDQIKRSRLCLSKKRLENPEKVLEDQNARQQKHREVKNKSDRLKEFREATKHAAVFICTCCQQRMFHSNVQLYTDVLKTDINAIKAGHTEKCVEQPIKTCLNEDEKIFICKTCVRHMKKNNIPPMSAMNGLQLSETDERIEQEGLTLTELEGALIAKSIIFQKIYQLPKSRWTP